MKHLSIGGVAGADVSESGLVLKAATVATLKNTGPLIETFAPATPPIQECFVIFP